MDDLTIRHAQKHQPWTVPYSQAVKACLPSMPHLLASHAVLHAAKSVGKLASVFESVDHSGEQPTPEQEYVIRDMAADLVTVALRLANLYGFDLESELVRRVHEKNGVSLHESPPRPLPRLGHVRPARG